MGWHDCAVKLMFLKEIVANQNPWKNWLTPPQHGVTFPSPLFYIIYCSLANSSQHSPSFIIPKYIYTINFLKWINKMIHPVLECSTWIFTTREGVSSHWQQSWKLSKLGLQNFWDLQRAYKMLQLALMDPSPRKNLIENWSFSPKR